MIKKIKIGDKVYCVHYCNYNLEIEEREIISIEDNIYCLNRKDSVMMYTTVIYYEDKDYFAGDCFATIYYRTKKKAIQEARKKIKSQIKSFKCSILEHKKLLKELNKELKND